MSKCDFAKRMKQLVARDIELTRTEVRLTKCKAKYHNELSKLHTSIQRECKETKALKKRVEQIQSESNKLIQYLNVETTQQHKDREEITYLENKCTVAQNKQRQLHLEQMDKLHCLKEVTNVYINEDALPKLLQGVNLCEKEKSTKLKPFCIDPTCCTQEEVQNQLWQKSEENTGLFDSHWQHLLFDCFRKDFNVCEKSYE